MSVGLNPLEEDTPDFVHIGKVAEIIRLRCGLDHLGVRIDETLRNSLFTLSANKWTLLELPLLLTNANFRRACMKNVENAEVRQYFEQCYDRMSLRDQATIAEPVLNKISSFIADPHFREIMGKRILRFRSNKQSTKAIGCWSICRGGSSGR